MNLKSLVHRELGEGLIEEELASAVEVSVQTIENILGNEVPQDPAIWEAFAQYFCIHAGFLRSGLFEFTENTHPSPVGLMRKVPLLRWDQIDQMVTREQPPRLIHADALLETDVPGKRTFAVQVIGNSMQPLFSEGEIVWSLGRLLNGVVIECLDLIWSQIFVVIDRLSRKGGAHDESQKAQRVCDHLLDRSPIAAHHANV